MAKYLKKFNTYNEYDYYINNDSSVTPNVSISLEENEIHYFPDIEHFYTAYPLDEKTNAIYEKIKREPKATKELVQRSWETKSSLTYEEFDGIIPDFEFSATTSCTYDSHNFKTLIIEDSVNYERNIIYVHGGAWTYQIDKVHLSFMDDFTHKANAKSYLPIYPMLPKWNYKYTMEMLLPLYLNLLNENKPIILMGDSAGANIVLGFTFYLKQSNITLPNYIFLISPPTDLTGSNKDMQKYDSKDAMLSPNLFDILGPGWAGELNVMNAIISPVYGNLKNFPPVFSFVGTEEIIYPDAIKFAKMLHANNINNKMLIGRGLWHTAVLSNIPARQLFINLLLNFMEN